MLVWTRHLSEEVRAHFSELGEMEYTGVGLSLFEGDEEHCNEVGQSMREAGIECSALCVLTKNTHSSGSCSVVDLTIEAHLQWLIDLSVVLGAECVVGPFFADSDAPSAEEILLGGRKRSAQVLGKVANYSKERSVGISQDVFNRFEPVFLKASKTVLLNGAEKSSMGGFCDSRVTSRCVALSV